MIPGDNFGAAAVTPPGHVASPRLDGADGEGPLGQRLDRADAGAFDPGRARGGAGVSGAVAEHDHGRPRLGGAADGGRGAGAARGAHEPGAHPGAGVARGQRLAGDAALRRQPLGGRPAERDRGQHQQPHHRRGLPRPPELRLGRQLPGSSARASSSATGSIIRWTASWRSRPTRSRRRRGCSCR